MSEQSAKFEIIRVVFPFTKGTADINFKKCLRYVGSVGCRSSDSDSNKWMFLIITFRYQSPGNFTIFMSFNLGCFLLDYVLAF